MPDFPDMPVIVGIPLFFVWTSRFKNIPVLLQEPESDYDMGKENDAIDEEKPLDETDNAYNALFGKACFRRHIVHCLGSGFIGQVGIAEQGNGLHQKKDGNAHRKKAVHPDEIAELGLAIFMSIDTLMQETGTGIAVNDHAGQQEHNYQQYRIGQGRWQYGQQHQRKKACHHHQNIGQNPVQKQ